MKRSAGLSPARCSNSKWPQLALARASHRANPVLFYLQGTFSILLTRARKGLSRPLHEGDDIEDAEECDGEALHAYGRDVATGEWTWEWVAVESLMEGGLGDLLPWLAA